MRPRRCTKGVELIAEYAEPVVQAKTLDAKQNCSGAFGLCSSSLLNVSVLLLKKANASCI